MRLVGVTNIFNRLNSKIRMTVTSLKCIIDKNNNFSRMQLKMTWKYKQLTEVAEIPRYDSNFQHNLLSVI